MMGTRAAKVDPRVRIIGMRVWPSRLCRSVCTGCGSEMEYEEAVLLQGPDGPFVVCPQCQGPAKLTAGPEDRSRCLLRVESEQERRDLLVAVSEQIERAQARLGEEGRLGAAEQAVLKQRAARLEGLFSRLCDL